MKAVNLLPSDMRKAAVKATARVRPERAEGIGAYVLLGALALCVTALAAYVLTNNSVKQRTADLEQVSAEAQAAARHAAALKPYADYEAMASARVATVQGLAAARFDWEQALRDLSRAVPAEVKLDRLSGDMGLPGTEGKGGDPLRDAIQAPAITVTGCAPSQPAVAAMMARLRAVDGVTRVSLSKSVKSDSGGGPTPVGDDADAPCGRKSPPSFSAVVFFEGSAALDNFSRDSASAAGSASSVPVPNAVEGAPADEGAAAPEGAADAGAPAGGETTTTSGSTP
jgi:Tfp pilus assembly protein PilN